jgi:hypothetical protein
MYTARDLPSPFRNAYFLGNVRCYSKDRDDDLFPIVDDEIPASDKVEIDVSSSGTAAATPLDEEDPFGVHFDDGTDQGKVGVLLPPKYKRDAATGRLTGEVEQELTVEEKRISV